MRKSEYKTVLYHLSSPNDVKFEYKHEIPVIIGLKNYAKY